jgi:tetratricopeptide (TPR) repeat protein
LVAEALRWYLLSINAIDPARALPLYTEAIACTERSGDHFINSRLNNNAGWAALMAGDIPAARAHLEAAAQAVQQIGWEDASVQENLRDVLRVERDLDGARSTFEAALRISRRNGDTWNMAYAILGLALLAGDAGDRDRAATLHGVAQAFQDRTGNPWQELAARDRRESLDKRAHTWAMSSWTGPTPRAWRSASTRPSTWLSRKPARPDRYRRQPS